MNGGKIMRILSIAIDNSVVCYAEFESEKLVNVGKVVFESVGDLHFIFYNMILNDKKHFIVLRGTNLNNIKRRNAIIETQIRTILKLISEQLGVAYATPLTSGWEKYLFGDRIQGKKLALEKLDIVNKLYDLELKYDNKNYYNNDLGIADAIIMGSAFITNKYKKVGGNEYGI